MGLSRMAHRIETACEGLRLVVEECPDGEAWQLFVYDVENWGVLHAAKRISCEADKNAAVEFAVAHLYSTDHDLKAGNVVANAGLGTDLMLMKKLEILFTLSQQILEGLNEHRRIEWLLKKHAAWNALAQFAIVGSRHKHNRDRREF